MVKSLKEIAELEFENILLQRRYQKNPTVEVIFGKLPDNPKACEFSSQFHLKFSDTQNIGFFLDMAPGRDLLFKTAKNKKVLNLFAYTCSLSVAALKGGAESVTNIDMSKAALSIGEKNHFLNDLDLRKARFLPYDILKSWNKIIKHGPYDIVIIDPPTNQGDSFKGERDYHKIIKRLPEMTSKDSIVMACLNSPQLTSQFLIDLFSEHAPQYKLQEILYSAFEDMETNAEEGLKIAVFKN